MQSCIKASPRNLCQYLPWSHHSLTPQNVRWQFAEQDSLCIVHPVLWSQVSKEAYLQKEAIFTHCPEDCPMEAISKSNISAMLAHYVFDGRAYSQYLDTCRDARFIQDNLQQHQFTSVPSWNRNYFPNVTGRKVEILEILPSGDGFIAVQISLTDSNPSSSFQSSKSWQCLQPAWHLCSWHGLSLSFCYALLKMHLARVILNLILVSLTQSWRGVCRQNYRVEHISHRQHHSWHRIHRNFSRRWYLEGLTLRRWLCTAQQ